MNIFINVFKSKEQSNYIDKIKIKYIIFSRTDSFVKKKKKEFTVRGGGLFIIRCKKKS